MAVEDHLTRLIHLLSTEERTVAERMQPVQLHALHYLSRANRYSDRPAAVAEFLGITKGTASQTLRVLEERGLLTRRRDPDDGRVVHLRPTRKGRELVSPERKPRLRAALDRLSARERDRLEQGLSALLRALQREHGGRTFGVCRSCRFFTQRPAGFECGLTGEPLRPAEGELLCREHEPATSA